MQLPVPDNPEQITQVVPHVASLGTLAATAIGWLPVLFALIPALYYCVLIWESKTMIAWRRRRRIKKASRRRARSKRRGG
jgi:hypothetical protein